MEFTTRARVTSPSHIATPTWSFSVEPPHDPSQLYGQILGGPASDKRLHGDCEELFIKNLGWLEMPDSVLDVGCGRGGWTKKVAPGLSPERLLVTDYVARQARKVRRELRQPPGFDWDHQMLDVGGDIEADLEGECFDFIFCLSVLMHLPPHKFAHAVANLKQRLNPGGKLVIANIAHAVAEHVYSPVSWLAEGEEGAEVLYLPRIKHLGSRPSRERIQSKVRNPRNIAEYYPADEHYLLAAEGAGFDVEVFELIAGKECESTPSGKKTVYAGIVGAPLWKGLAATRKA